jgi:hypothetical protein
MEQIIGVGAYGLERKVAEFLGIEEVVDHQRVSCCCESTIRYGDLLTGEGLR